MKMKLYSAVLLITLSISSAFLSCKKTAAGYTGNPIPLAVAVTSDTSLRLFTEILQRSNNIGLLAKPDSFTILAPVNSAFISAGLPDSIIRSLSASALDFIARYHFISSPVHIVQGAYTGFSTLLQPPVYGYSNSDGSVTYFNNSTVLNKQAITGSNATLYKLNTPLTIGSDSLSQLLSADSTLSFFAAALVHTSFVMPATTGNTILIPDNNAFINAGYPDTTSINSADSATLTHILQYHVLPGLYFSNSFKGLATVNTLQGSTLNVGFSNGILQFTGNSNTTPAIVILSDKVAGINLVAFRINGLLLP
jgi:uncharacterized surface protein with fasciclin (FAS1) repeats